VLSWICHQGINQHSREEHCPSLCQTTMAQCDTPGTTAEKSKWHSSLRHTRPTTWHHNNTSRTTTEITSWVATCRRADPANATPEPTLWPGMPNWLSHKIIQPILCHRKEKQFNTAFLLEIVNAESFLIQLSMAHRCACVDAWFHCNAMMVSNGQKNLYQSHLLLRRGVWFFFVSLRQVTVL